MHAGLRRNLIAALAVATLSTPGQAQDLTDIQMPRGYRALELPGDYGGRPLAGSLVQISPDRGFRFLGHLSDCGLPSRPLEVLRSLGADTQVSQRELELDISIGARLLELFSIRADADRIAKIRVTLGAVVDEMVIPIAVVSAARANADVLRERCGSFLREPNVYWVNNALKTDRLLIEFLDDSGASISASAANVRGVAQDVSAEAAVRFVSGSVIIVDKPVYIAFRDAPPLELLTGDLSLFSTDDSEKATSFTYGDEVYE